MSACMNAPGILMVVTSRLFSGVNHTCQHDRFDGNHWCACIFFVGVCALTLTICTAMTFDSATAFLLEEHEILKSGASFIMGKFVGKLGLHNVAIMKLLHFHQDSFDACFSKDF